MASRHKRIIAHGHDQQLARRRNPQLPHTKASSVYEFNKTSVTHGKIHSAPDSSRNRYITEDVPYVLVPCFELAGVLELKVPLIESCIHIASAFNDADYFHEGRTLDKLNLEGKTVNQILDYVNR